MKNYLAKLIFQIEIGNTKHNSQFDEQTRLIVANNCEEAFFKARKIGREAEDLFLANDQSPVAWKFIDVTDLYELQEYNDGEQIYSATHEQSDARSFIEFVKRKSMLIQSKSLTFA